MAKAIDLTGQRFGRLTVIERVGNDEHGGVLWKCKCDCGNYKLTNTSKLRAGDSRSCGCLYTPGHSTFKDLTGKRFGKLVVLNVEGKNKGGNYLWRCRCVCGNEVIVAAGHLNDGHTTTCGGSIHKINYKHGMWNTRLYRILLGMKRRCYSKRTKYYNYYGGRGIKICDEWMDKEIGSSNFISWALNTGYKDNLTIDRIDVNGNYEPSNCRWATFGEQMLNTRRNVFYLLNGEKVCQSELCKRIGIDCNKVISRKSRGKTEIKDLFKGVDLEKYKIERLQ